MKDQAARTRRSLAAHPRWCAVAATLVLHGGLLSVLACYGLGGGVPRQTLPLTASFAQPIPLEEPRLIERVEVEPDIQHVQDFHVALAESASETPDVAGLAGGGRWSQLSESSREFGLEGALIDQIGTGLGDSGSGFGDGGRGRYQPQFEALVEELRQNGLDVVLVFDSTSSMGPEINVVKQKILQIGGTLLTKVPETRIGICTYRDFGDAYTARGLPLTSDLQAVHRYLLEVFPAGGGLDIPEAVQEGLRWSLANNAFRRKARKMILLFGDAPPRPRDLPTCLWVAGQFRDRDGGIVSTITCRSRQRLPEFVAIAQAGGGEAFLIQNHARIMEELLVLIFGGEHRKDVIRFFGLEPPAVRNGRKPARKVASRRVRPRVTNPP